MSVEITPELESLVQTILQGGNYRNENEVLDEALRLLEKREQLRREVKAGVEQLDHGEYSEYDHNSRACFLKDIKTEQRERFGETNVDE